MMKVIGIVLIVFLCVFMLFGAIGAIFLNLFDKIDDERPEEEI